MDAVTVVKHHVGHRYSKRRVLVWITLFCKIACAFRPSVKLSLNPSWRKRIAARVPHEKQGTSTGDFLYLPWHDLSCLSNPCSTHPAAHTEL